MSLSPADFGQLGDMARTVAQHFDTARLLASQGKSSEAVQAQRGALALMVAMVREAALRQEMSQRRP